MFRLDIGAPKSVTGLYVLRKLCHGKSFQLTPSHSSFRFRDDTQKSLRTSFLSFMTPPCIYDVMIKSDVVDNDVPSLLGFDVMF